MANLTQPTKNLISNIMANSKQAEPAIGMGATKLMYTDRHPFTVIAILKKNKAGKATMIEVQEDNYKRIDKLGKTDSGQQYEFTPNPDGSKYTLTLRKNGRWVKQGDPLKNGQTFMIGHRDKYHDFSF